MLALICYRAISWFEIYGPERIYSAARAITIAAAVDIGIYAALVVGFQFGGRVQGTMGAEDFEIFRMALIAVAIMEIGAILIVRKFLIGDFRKTDMSGQKAFEGLLMLILVTCLICESIAVYGIVAFFISGITLNFYIFMGIGLIGIAIYFPKRDHLETLLQEITGE